MLLSPAASVLVQNRVYSESSLSLFHCSVAWFYRVKLKRTFYNHLDYFSALLQPYSESPFYEVLLEGSHFTNFQFVNSESLQQITFK